MKIISLQPISVNWKEIESENLMGEIGSANIKTKTFADIKVRRIIYSKNYKADHWCDKGHIVIVIDGQLIIEYKDRENNVIDAGMTYLVGDNSRAHRAISNIGAEVFVID